MSQAPPPVFHDANLHLAVLQAACKEGRLPWFDKARYFAETRPRPYDDAAEYNYRSDAEIEAALLALDIEPHLGDIRAIDWDASAEVIASIWTYWDGRDTRFDIRSPAGIERLERFRCAFCAMGDLSPLRELDQLREVVLVGARITSLLDFARMPALERLDLRGCTLLDHKQIALERSTLSGLGVQVTFDGRQAPPTPRLSRRLGRARQRSVLPPEEHRSTRPPKIVDRAIPIPAVPAMALMESVDPRIPAVARALSVDFTGEPQIHSRREDTNLGYRRVRESRFDAGSLHVWTQLVRVYHKLRELSRLTLTIEIKTGPPRIRTLRLKVFSDDGSEMVDELALSCTGFEATEVKTLLAALGLPAG